MSARSAILPPQRENNQHLVSCWTAGLAVLFLGIGLSGAGTSLLPPPAPPVQRAETGDDLIQMEEFEAPPPMEGEEAPEGDPEIAPEEEPLEIPPLPEITPPLTPPEMADLTPVEELPEPPKPEPKPKPRPQPPSPSKPKPVTPRPPSGIAGQPGGTPGGPSSAGGAPGGTGRSASAGRGGKGRFPHPAYPAAARRGNLQGTVRLAVTVEAGGLPVSVSVISSSGHAVLDAAARDQVQRRWRWPSSPDGGVRTFRVPVRFVLR